MIYDIGTPYPFYVTWMLIFWVVLSIWVEEVGLLDTSSIGGDRVLFHVFSLPIKLFSFYILGDNTAGIKNLLAILQIEEIPALKFNTEKSGIAGINMEASLASIVGFMV